MAYKTHRGACCHEPDEEEVNEACGSPHLDPGRQGQQRGQTSVFLEGVLQRKKQLAEVLEWLASTQRSMQRLDEQSEANVPTSISNITNNLEESLAHVDSCIHALDDICSRLFNAEVTKTKKDETDDKDGVWIWWREKKMDVKTMKRIQCLHPPSVENILKDPCLAIKSSADLSFMLQDFVDSIDLNKPMKTAFKFAQLGLHNLNQALQECTKESRRYQAEVKELTMADCRFEMAQLKVQFEDSKLKRSAMEEELSSCKEQNQALLLQIETMQRNHRTTQQQKPEVVPQNVEDVSSGRPDTQPLSTGHELPPLPLKSPSQTAEMAEDLAVEEAEEEEEEEEEGVVNVVTRPEEEQYITEQVEKKKSGNLLEDFQNSVLKIIDECRQGGGMDNKDLSLHEVYSVLQSTIKSSFQHLVHHLDDTVTESSVDLPPLDSVEPESEYSNDTQTSPVDLLNALSEDIKQQEMSVEEASLTIEDLFGPNQQNVVNMKGETLHRAVAGLMGQLKNINDKGKKQICKMRRTLESMVDAHNQMSALRDIDVSLAVKKSSSLLAAGPELSPKTSDNQAREVVKEKMFRGKPKWRKQSELIHNPETIPVIPCPTMDHVGRYITEMAAIAEELGEEKKGVLQGSNREESWVLLVDLQRTNLKLLTQAVDDGGISAELYELTKGLIVNALGSIGQRLACLCRRFIRRQALKHVRKQLNARLRRAMDMEDGRLLKGLYSAFQKLDSYESKVLELWRKRQVSIEHTRSICIAQLRYLFWQLRVDYHLQLAVPVSCFDYPLLQPSLTVPAKKLHWSLLPIPFPLPRPPSGLPRSMRPLPVSSLSKPTGSELAFKEPPLQAHRIREIASRQTQAQWQTDMPLPSAALASNTPVATPAGPRHAPLTLELNVNWGRITTQYALQDR